MNNLVPNVKSWTLFLMKKKSEVLKSNIKIYTLIVCGVCIYMYVCICDHKHHPWL